MNRNILVIGGGVGPAASVAFHEKIVNMTDNGTAGDQGHASVVHISMSQFIKDRTAFIRDGGEPNPGSVMGDLVQASCKAYAKLRGDFVVGVPCNTFHSPVVFNAYQRYLQNPRIKTVNMIESTANYLGANCQGKKVILLSTRGTRDTGVYHNYCQENPDFEFITCNAADDAIDSNSANDKSVAAFLKEDGEPDIAKIAENPQGAIMAAIYGVERGIKSIVGDWEINFKIFEAVIQSIIGDDNPANYCVIMGCTEIPLAYAKAFAREARTVLGGDAYIDPMDILAANMIEKSGYGLKEEFGGLVVDQAVASVSPYPLSKL
ncbi:MAG: aspartate/glutamate racemase family protein [Sneathiella sp.]